MSSQMMLQKGLLSLLIITVFIILLFMYLSRSRPSRCKPHPISWNQQYKSDPSKPILLLWFWPEDLKFNLRDCRTEYGIDECFVTDDRSSFEDAEGVLIYHRAIEPNLTNLPPRIRPPFQKWIWFNPDPPPRTQNLTNLNNLFNLTMSYRKDADIKVRVRVLSRKTPMQFVMPQKDKLVCWVSDEKDLGVARRFYDELQKHVEIHVFGEAFGKPLPLDKYYSTIASCKFHLSLESSIYPDYITKTLLDPLSSGTVPVVLGPPRKNYEDFIPRDSFIHVNDFPNVKSLVEALNRLAADTTAYGNYFAWRKFLYAEPRHLESEKRFLRDICLACRHLGTRRVYRRVHDVYKWFYNKPNWLP